jgi:hypothetical protein
MILSKFGLLAHAMALDALMSFSPNPSKINNKFVFLLMKISPF